MPRRMALFPIVAILGLVLLLAVVASHSSTQSLATTNKSVTEDSLFAGRLTPGSGSNVSPCDVFAATYGNDTSIPYYENYSLMFSKLCQTPQFVALYEGMGPSGFFLVGGTTHGSELPELTFALDWAANCTNSSLRQIFGECAFEAYWVGYLTNNSVAGPYVEQYAEIYMGGPAIPAGNSPRGVEAWTILAVAVIGISAVSGATVVTVRRRAKLREGVLLDQKESSIVTVEGAPTQQAEQEPTDTLEDIF